jgi:DNA-binding PadR family transcriptional regulator
MSWHTCSGFQRDLLQAIAACTQTGEVPYGLAVKAQLDDRYDETVNHSRLYQNLDRLCTQDLVTCSAVDDRTNRYELTAAGERALRDQASQLHALAESLDPPAAEPTAEGRPTNPMEGQS